MGWRWEKNGGGKQTKNKAIRPLYMDWERKKRKERGEKERKDERIVSAREPGLDAGETSVLLFSEEDNMEEISQCFGLAWKGPMMGLGWR
jgi:hypothetical protein